MSPSGLTFDGRRGVHARRLRKLLTSAALGVWVFALIVGVANACGWTDAFTPSAMAGVAHEAASHGDEGTSDCVKLCAEGLPVLAKVQAVQDPPEGEPLIIAPGHGVDLWRRSAPTLRPLHARRAPRAVPPLLRFLRLTL